MKDLYDVIVVGLGAMGSASLYQLSKKDLKIAGIDQYHPPHALGSSHGETRITREIIGEGEVCIPLVKETQGIWKELEHITGKTLFEKTGGYIIGNKNSEMLFHDTKDFINHSARLAKKFNIPYALKSSNQLKEEISLLSISDEETGLYEPGAGILFPEEIIESQLHLAKENDAQLFFDEKVISYTQQGDFVKIETNKRALFTKKALITTGPWINDFLPENEKRNVKVYKQEIFWFEVKDQKTIAPDVFPWIIWMGKKLSDFRTFFPTPLNGTNGIKFVTEQYIEDSHPDTVDRTITQNRIDAVYKKYIKPISTDIMNNCLQKDVCFYTVTPNSNFIIDWHPDHKNVLFASPCSGHGFKHSGGIGKLLSQKILGEKEMIPTHSFRFDQFD